MRNVRTLVTVAIAVLLAWACDGLPTLPESPATGLSSAFGRDGGTVTVPMEVDATFMWTVSGATAADCPDLIDPSTGELFTAEGSGRGEATHLGRFEITELDHPTINLCSLLESPPALPDASDVTRTGVFEFLAADGSTIFGSYEFFAPIPPSPEAFFTFAIEGGTGRMAGASGALAVLPEASGEPGPVDPADVLLLGKVSWDPVVAEGEITLPRPGHGN